MNETSPLEFRPFAKMARLNREIIITEKLDGSNAQILINETGTTMLVGSRNRYLTVDNNNYGFARWCQENLDELWKLGPGRHFGEWWGNGIQRNYGLKEKRFSLFDVRRWKYINGIGSGLCTKEDSGEWVNGPACCHVVPTLWRGPMITRCIEETVAELRMSGSVAAPGFMDPEGIVIYHTAAGQCFKVTLKNDDKPKSLV